MVRPRTVVLTVLSVAAVLITVTVIFVTIVTIIFRIFRLKIGEIRGIFRTHRLRTRRKNTPNRRTWRVTRVIFPGTTVRTSIAVGVQCAIISMMRGMMFMCVLL